MPTCVLVFKPNLLMGFLFIPTLAMLRTKHRGFWKARTYFYANQTNCDTCVRPKHVRFGLQMKPM